MRIGWLLALLIGLPPTASPAAAQDYYVGHPRLLFGSGDLQALRTKVNAGGDADIAYTAIHSWASLVLSSPPANLLGSWEGAHTVSQLALTGCIETSGEPFAAKACEVALYLARNRAPTSDEFASALRLQSLAYAYDMSGATATPAERAEIRQAMRTYLDYMPVHFNYYCQAYNPYTGNHGMTVGASMGLAAIALWDDVLPSGRDSLQAALTFGDQLVQKCSTDILGADGSYREGVLYAGWVVRMAAPYFEARRRFDATDLAADPRWRHLVEWLCYELDPAGGGRTLNLNDSPSSTRPLALHGTVLEWAQARWSDPLAKYLHKHVVGTYGYDYGLYADRVATVLWSQSMWDVSPATRLPRSHLFASRGLYFYRSGWKTAAVGNEVLFSFFSGPFFGGHAQEDQNQFTLTAFGRHWATDCGGVGTTQTPKETAAHNLILVDGRGEHNAGNSIGTDGRIAAVQISSFADYLRGDAMQAYATYSPFNAPGQPFPTSDWSWGYDGGNPLQRASRVCLVVKAGETPAYVVVADDIRKDDAVHDYDWLLHTESTHNFDLASDPAEITAPQGALDVYFAHPRPADLSLTWAPFTHGGVDPPTRRLVARAHTIEPRYCVVLVPRANGTPAPAYSASDDSAVTHFGVDWGTLQDEGVFAPHHDATAGSLVTDAMFAFVRRDANGVRRWLLAEGTHLEAGPQTLATFADTVLAVCSGDTVHLSRPDVDYLAWAPDAVAVLGPAGPLSFRRDGDWIRNTTPTAILPGAPDGMWLAPLQPNPARALATAAFQVPFAGRARVVVLDVRGARVATLRDAVLEAGVHRAVWNGRDAGGRLCAAGTYFVVVEFAGRRATQKLVWTR
jgi:hypothetical protein